MALESPVNYINDLNMRPSFAPNNAMALLWAYAVLLCQFGKRNSTSSVFSAHGNNFRFSKFGACGINALPHAQAIFGVKNILLMRNPFEIRNVIVRWVKVNMINHASMRGFGNKMNSNQSMNRRSFFLPIFAKLNSKIAESSWIWDKHPSTSMSAFFSNTSHSAKIGNFVHAFVARNWQPDFIHDQLLNVDSPMMKICGRQHRNCFSGATLPAQGVF